MMQLLPPMAENGKWLKTPDNRPPVYVVHEAHIKRMMSDEGAQPIADPRDPAQVRMQQQSQLQAESKETAMQARIDQLEAMVKQLLAAKNEEHSETSEHPTKRSK